MGTEPRFQKHLFHKSSRRLPRYLVLPFHQNCSFRPPKFTTSFVPRDSVNSVGLVPQRLPFTFASSGIRIYRHAVSLDERRTKFKVNLSPHEGGEKEGPGIEQRRRDKPKKEPTLFELERKWSDPCVQTDVQEVWFAGERATRDWDQAPTDIWF